MEKLDLSPQLLSWLDVHAVSFKKMVASRKQRGGCNVSNLSRKREEFKSLLNASRKGWNRLEQLLKIYLTLMLHLFSGWKRMVCQNRFPVPNRTMSKLKTIVVK